MYFNLSNSRNITNLSYAFNNCTNLTSINNTKEWHMQNVQNMHSIFYNCYSYKGSPMSGPNVIDMRNSYYNCTNLTGAPECGNNVWYMNNAYFNCKSLFGNPVIGSNVHYMSNAYRDCDNIGPNAYVLGDIVLNAANCFMNKDSRKLNIFVPENSSFTLNSFLVNNSQSIVGTYITWTNAMDISGCYYNTQYNTYIYPISNVAQKLKEDEHLIANYTINTSYNEIPKFNNEVITRTIEISDFAGSYDLGYIGSIDNILIDDKPYNYEEKYRLSDGSIVYDAGGIGTYSEVLTIYPNGRGELFTSESVSGYTVTITIPTYEIDVYKTTSFDSSFDYTVEPLLEYLGKVANGPEDILYSTHEQVLDNPQSITEYDNYTRYALSSFSWIDIYNDGNAYIYSTEPVADSIIVIEKYKDYKVVSKTVSSSDNKLKRNIEITARDRNKHPSQIIFSNIADPTNSQYTNMQDALLEIDYVSLKHISNISDMFASCWNLTNVNTSSWDMTGVVDMSSAFSGCSNLKSSPICGPNVKNMERTYYYCNRITGAPVCGDNVTDFNYTYYQCRNLTGAPVCGNNVINMAYAYQGCTNLTGDPVCGPNVTNMAYAYYGCPNIYGNFYVYSDNIANVENCFYNRNNSRMLNIYVKNGTTSTTKLQYSSVPGSIVGQTISWSGNTTYSYNALYNIHIYKVESVEQARIDNGD